MSNEFGESHIFHEEKPSEEYHSSDAAHIFGPDDVNAAIAETEKITGDKTAIIEQPKEHQEHISESPRSLFSQAYEAVRNTDTVSNIVDHVQIWWRGRHVDAITRDIARLEDLMTTQDTHADRHDQRMQASAGHAAVLGEVRSALNTKEMPVSHTEARDAEHASVAARAELHRTASEKISAELMQKQELKARYEQDRASARDRVAERFESKVAKNAEAIARIDSAVDEILKNLEVADTIVANLTAEKARVEQIAMAPDALVADKKAARVIAQDLEGRIQDMRSKMQIQQEAIKRHNDKRFALNTQKEKWESKIARKESVQSSSSVVEQGDAEDAAKLEGFVHETEAEIAGQEVGSENPEDAGVDTTDTTLPVAEEATESKDPWVLLLGQIQEIMKDPEYQKYDEEEFRQNIEQHGTAEQKLLLQNRIFLTSLFGWLESAKTVEQERQGKQERVEEGSLQSFMREYDELIDAEQENKDIAALFDTENRQRIEAGEGTPQQTFLVKLLELLERFFAESLSTNRKDQTSKSSLL